MSEVDLVEDQVRLYFQISHSNQHKYNTLIHAYIQNDLMKDHSHHLTREFVHDLNQWQPFGVLYFEK